MADKLIREYEEDTATATGDLFIVQKADNTVVSRTASNAVVPYSVTKDNIDYTTTGLGGIWWKELSRTTLTSAGTSLQVTNIPSTKYLRIMIYVIASGSIDGKFQFNTDSGSNYSKRASADGGADATSVSQTSLAVIGASTRSPHAFFDVMNFPTVEKLIFWDRSDPNGAGAAVIPERLENAGKWANSTDYITTINYYTTAGGNFAIGSKIIVLGHN